jgi:hypothetical protein
MWNYKPQIQPSCALCRPPAQPKQAPVAKPQAAAAAAAAKPAEQQQPEGQQQKQRQQRRIVPQPVQGAAAAGATPQPVQTAAMGASGPAPSQGMLPGAEQPVPAPGTVQHPCSAPQCVDLTEEKPAAVMQPQACCGSGDTAACGVSIADGTLKRAGSTTGGEQQVPGRALLDTTASSMLGNVMLASDVSMLQVASGVNPNPPLSALCSVQFTKKPRRLTPVAVSSAMPLKDSGPHISCQVQPGAGSVSREVLLQAPMHIWKFCCLIAL